MKRCAAKGPGWCGPTARVLCPTLIARAELAPRDIVARAIDHEMKRLGVDCMYWISAISLKPLCVHTSDDLRKPVTFGFRSTKDTGFPVVPAAHYTCGGVMVNAQGRTDINGLYASCEVSYTGLHGANRMAPTRCSNALYWWSAAEDLLRVLPEVEAVDNLPAWDDSQVDDADERVVIQHNWHECGYLCGD